MNFKNKVMDCVIAHYSGSFRGNTRQIGERYQIFGKSARKKFIWDSKLYAHGLGKIFIFDYSLNTFIVDDENNNARVSETLMNDYKQGRSIRLHMGMLHSNGLISDDVYNVFLDNDSKRLDLISNV